MARPSSVTPRETAPSTKFIGFWVSPTADLEVIQKRNISFLCRESNHDSSVLQTIAYSLYLLSYSGSQINIYTLFNIQGAA
jgi:hypothetical protein